MCVLCIKKEIAFLLDLNYIYLDSELVQNKLLGAFPVKTPEQVTHQCYVRKRWELLELMQRQSVMRTTSFHVLPLSLLFLFTLEVELPCHCCFRLLQCITISTRYCFYNRKQLISVSKIQITLGFWG